MLPKHFREPPYLLLCYREINISSKGRTLDHGSANSETSPSRSRTRHPSPNSAQKQNRPGLLSDTSVPRIEFHSLSTRHEFRVDDRVYPVKRFADICSWKSGTPTGDVRPSNARRRVGNDTIWNASNRILCVRSNKI